MSSARPDQGELARLTRSHRAEQGSVAAQMLRRLLPMWQLLDPTKLDATGPAWVDAVTPLITTAYQKSADLAGQYLQTMRTLQLGLGTAPPVTVRPNTAAIRTSLLVTGPIGIKQRTSRLPAPPAVDEPPAAKPILTGIEQATDAAFVDVAGASIRHTLAGGRDLSIAQLHADPQALGWQRVGDGNPCYFCAMLISRGPVYKAGSFAESDPRFTGFGQFKVHDHDGCQMEPVYRDMPLSADAARFQRIWNESGASSLSGRDAVNTFRKAYESGATPPGTPPGGKPPAPPRPSLPPGPGDDEPLIPMSRRVDQSPGTGIGVSRPPIGFDEIPTANIAPPDDPAKYWNADEARVGQWLASHGLDVSSVKPIDQPRVKTPDAIVLDRALTLEKKTLEAGSSSDLRRVVRDGRKQSRRIVVDGRAALLTLEVAEAAIKRVIGSQYGVDVDELVVILADGSAVSWWHG